MRGLDILTEFSKKAGEKLEPKNIKIDDTTLRDGEQTAGVVFANDEKIYIAKMLDRIGVHQIEAGIPTMGGDEKDAIKAITALNLNCSILGWNRAVVSDIDDSIECGVDAEAISIKSSMSETNTNSVKAGSGCWKACAPLLTMQRNIIYMCQ